MEPEAILTLHSVRHLETMTDIGPGGVTPLLIEVNFRQHRAHLAILREAGFTLTAPPVPVEPDAELVLAVAEVFPHEDGQKAWWASFNRRDPRLQRELVDDLHRRRR